MSNTFKLRNGRILISTEAPGGIYNASQLKKIASLCDGDSVMVKATEDQRLALIVTQEKASFIANELKSMGLGIRHYQDGLHQPVSCIGEMCEFHDQDALGSALDISGEIEGIKLKTPLKIGLNGCARCCVPCHTLDVSLVGDTSGYRISLGGKSSQLPEIAGFMAEGVPPAEVARLVRSIVEIYRDHAKENETLQELIDREGAASFIKALAPWSQDAADNSDPFAAGSDQVSTVSDGEILDESMSSIDTETGIEAATDASASLEDTIPSFEEVDDAQVAVASEAPQPSEENESIDQTESSVGALESAEPEYAIDVSATSADVGVAPEIPVAMAEEINGPHLTVNEISGNAPDITFEETSVNNEDATTPASATQVTEFEASLELHHDEDTNPAGSESLAETEHDENKIEDSEAIAEEQISAGIDAVEEDVGRDQIDEEREEASHLLDEIPVNASVGFSEQSPGPTKTDSTAVATTPIYLLPPARIPEEKVESTVAETSPQQSLDPVELNTAQIAPPATAETVKESTTKVSAPIQNPPKKQWTLSGFDIDDLGNPVIAWSNGVVLTVTQETLMNGSLRFGGHEIKVSRADNGIHVEVDGMRMFLPAAA